MKPIPLIVGFGGLSAAGRSAFHIAYNRLVIEEIDKSDKLQTFASLAIMMNLVNYEKEQFYTLEKKKISLEEIEQKYGDYIKKNTLLRKIPKKEFAKDSIFQNSKIKITSSAFQQIKAFSQPIGSFLGGVMMDSDSLLQSLLANSLHTSLYLVFWLVKKLLFLLPEYLKTDFGRKL